jgi:molecular chaperone GrpE
MEKKREELAKEQEAPKGGKGSKPKNSNGHSKKGNGHKNGCKEELEKLRKQKEELEKKLDEALRAYARCENDKKILKKEVEAQVEYAYERFAKDLLPVVDSLELAIEHAKKIENREEAFEKLVEGVELTLKKMLDVFKNHGIEPVHHEEFDPHLHQAVQHVESEEHEEGAIVDVYQKGYTLKGRVIRPSIVTINKKNS